MGPECREPPRQIGSASSPLSSSSSFSSKGGNSENSEVLHVVEGLIGILNDVAPAVELIKIQVMQIEELKGALETVRTELSSMVGDLGSADVLVIKSLQGTIYDVLGMLDENGDAKAVPAAPPSASPASPSSSSSSSSSPAPTPARVPKREPEGAEALARAVKVARFEGRGKMAAAAAELGSLPQGSHVGPQGPPVVQRRTGGALSIHECSHTDGRCGEDDEAAKWEEKGGRARLEQ